MSDSGYSNPNQNQNGDVLSRQSSFMSLTSGKSVYLTANEFSTDDELDSASASAADSLRSGSGSGSEVANASGSASTGTKDEDLVDNGNTNLKAKHLNPHFSHFEPPLSRVRAGELRAHLHNQQKIGTDGELDSASSTLEENDTSAESVMSSDEDNAVRDEDDIDGNINLTLVDDGEAIQEDVSKICNEIAEAQQPDFQKQAEIERATFENISQLRGLAISEGGLLTNQLRVRSWPLLLGISMLDIQDQQKYRVPNYFPDVSDKIKDLVQLDVNRVLKRFPPNLSEVQQDHIQSYLNTLVLAVLQENPQAHYYQGFHDISLTFLLVCLSQNVPYLAYLSLNQMVRTTLAPFMEKTMDATHDIIHVVFALLEQEDKALYHKIVIESKCPAAFCLAWVITWFSHTLPHDTDIFRLSDFILGSSDQLNPSYLIPVFLSTALVLRNSSDIKENVLETDIATMHHALARLPLNEISLEPWLKDTTKLMKKFAGKEKQLMARAVRIKQIQNDLWNDETVDHRRRPVARNANVIVVAGRYVFIRHKWITLAIFAIGAAFLAQKYAHNYPLNSIFSPFRNFVGNRFMKMNPRTQ